MCQLLFEVFVCFLKTFFKYIEFTCFDFDFAVGKIIQIFIVLGIQANKHTLNMNVEKSHLVLGGKGDHVCMQVNKTLLSIVKTNL